MTPKELRNERLAERMIKNLKRRNMEAFYCKTSEETIQKVLELIPDGSSITWGGSMTIRDMGLPDALRKKGTYDYCLEAASLKASMMAVGRWLRKAPKR